jgi:hypothetical protein
MLREKLYDAGEIVETILTQPLSIPGLQKNVSLLEASKHYLADPTSVELKKMLETFLRNPAALEIMLQEFKLLSQDLH